jgi:hypothetical protein
VPRGRQGLRAATALVSEVPCCRGGRNQRPVLVCREQPGHADRSHSEWPAVAAHSLAHPVWTAAEAQRMPNSQAQACKALPSHAVRTRLVPVWQLLRGHEAQNRRVSQEEADHLLDLLALLDVASHQALLLVLQVAANHSLGLLALQVVANRCVALQVLQAVADRSLGLQVLQEVANQCWLGCWAVAQPLPP